MVHFDAKLSGTVEDVSLADLLQLLNFARKSIQLHVCGSRPGTVAMVDGEIHDSECDGRRGEDALAILLAQRVVRVRATALEQPPPRTVRRTFGAVVLDLLRRQDEFDRDTGDLPEAWGPPPRVTLLEQRLVEWVDDRPDVDHAALIDPRQQFVVACDSPALWTKLVSTSFMSTLAAPYFDDVLSEIQKVLPETPAAANAEEGQTVMTFGGRRYVLGHVRPRGWVAVLIFRADYVSHGLSLTHMVSFRQSVEGWANAVVAEPSPQTAPSELEYSEYSAVGT